MGFELSWEVDICFVNAVFVVVIGVLIDEDLALAATINEGIRLVLLDFIFHVCDEASAGGDFIAGANALCVDVIVFSGGTLGALPS